MIDAELGLNLETQKHKFRGMKVLMLGLPGVGKSTLLDHIGQINEIGLGKITRSIHPESDLGREIATYAQTGLTWPDELIHRLIVPTFRQFADNGFVIDGLPKKDSECILLQNMIAEAQIPKLDLMLHLTIDPEIAVRRRQGREMIQGVRLTDSAAYELRVQMYQEGVYRWIENLSPWFSHYIEINTTSLSSAEVVNNLLMQIT
jgi:adenylate kinase family enzyme